MMVGISAQFYSPRQVQRQLQQRIRHVFFGELPENRYTNVAVVDSFDKKLVDIDGDSIADLSHGEVIERILKGLNPYLSIERYPVASLQDRNTHPVSLLETLNLLLTHIKSGKKVDVVNFSISSTGTAQAVQALKSLPLREQLKNSGNFDEKLLAKKLDIMEALTYRGVDVYACAGNEKGDSYSHYAAVNTVNVIAQADFEGNPINHLDLSDPLITDFHQGKYAVTQLKEGFDITGDNIVDVLNEEVSGKGKPVSAVSLFNGKKPDSAKIGTVDDIKHLLQRGGSYIQQHQLTTPADFTPEVIRELHTYVAEGALAKEKLYKLSDLAEVGLITQPSFEYAKKYGEYALYPAYKSEVVFRVDENGLLQYNPDNSGRKNVVNTIQGSSYATPTGIAKDYQPVR